MVLWAMSPFYTPCNGDEPFFNFSFTGEKLLCSIFSHHNYSVFGMILKCMKSSNFHFFPFYFSLSATVLKSLEFLAKLGGGLCKKGNEMDPVFKFVLCVSCFGGIFLCWYLTVIEPCNFFDTCSIVRFFWVPPYEKCSRV